MSGTESQLLVIDVGNTNMSCGVYRDSELVHSYRLTTRADRTSDELALSVLGGLGLGGVEPQAIGSVVVGSVVPQLHQVLDTMLSLRLGVRPLWLEPGVRTGMPILSENPHEVGADRIANGVAVLATQGGPAVVVDFGTATTFDVVSARGEYIGGVIAPGVEISASALASRAARLPRVEIRRPQSVIGRNTVQAMQSGLFHGYVALISGLLERVLEELGGQVHVVATGGLASLVAPHVPAIQLIDPDLTLEGLRLIHERNPR